MNITSIILAAGANTRLGGIVAPFMKPFILVNGRPLIHHALTHSLTWNTQRDVIVCSPENARLLIDLVPETDDEPFNLRWVLQPHPTGVANAVYLALPYVDTEWCLILCGDNTFSPLPLDTRALIGRLGAFGARTIDGQSALRFTRFVHRKNDLDITAHDHGSDQFSASVNGGVEFINDDHTFGDGCWIGPLLLKTDALRKIRDLRLPLFNVVNMIRQATDDGRGIQPLPMLCEDLGVPEELMR